MWYNVEPWQKSILFRSTLEPSPLPMDPLVTLRSQNTKKPERQNARTKPQKAPPKVSEPPGPGSSHAEHKVRNGKRHTSSTSTPRTTAHPRTGDTATPCAPACLSACGSGGHRPYSDGRGLPAGAQVSGWPAPWERWERQQRRVLALALGLNVSYVTRAV
jgi:hypothetical protein